MKVGILKETKTPPDKRVPLTPAQCAQVKAQYPSIELVVEPSDIRKYRDEEYQQAGITLQYDLSDCDILIGVKEVKILTLIDGKTYLFFSHTYKEQEYNAELLRTILNKKIRLVDYELIKDTNGKRLIGFGRYAGIVGCYNGFRTFGLKHGLYSLKKASDCEDRAEMEGELSKVTLPSHMKVVLTGFGRVGHGAREIMALLPIEEVDADRFKSETFNHPVFTHLDSGGYNRRSSDGGFDKSEFYTDPSAYESFFMDFAEVSDMYVACHYWGEGSPFIFTRDDMKRPSWKVSVVADVSCDIDGPVACTLRPSTIADPIYGYDPASESETDYKNQGAVAVMAVDNLPCELPKDASEDFGNELIKNVFPHLFGNDEDGIIAGASETDLEGNLTPDFAYLEDYVANA